MSLSDHRSSKVKLRKIKFLFEKFNLDLLVNPYLAEFNPLPDDKILDWSKLEKKLQTTFKSAFKMENKSVPYRVENIMRKTEIACYKQFLLFSQCFPQLYIFSALKCGIV